MADDESWLVSNLLYTSCSSSLSPNTQTRPPNIAVWHKRVQSNAKWGAKLVSTQFAQPKGTRGRLFLYTVPNPLFLGGNRELSGGPWWLFGGTAAWAEREYTHKSTQRRNLCVLSALNNTTLNYPYPNEWKPYDPFIGHTLLRRYTKPSAYLTMGRLFKYKFIQREERSGTGRCFVSKDRFQRDRRV